MANNIVDISQWRDQLTAHLPAQLRALVEGASGRDLVKKVNTTFVLFDNVLAHVETRKSVELVNCEANSIAAGCEQLLASLSEEQRKDCVALLLLPAKFFVATTTTMPGVAQENLVAALRIQAENILPSLETRVALAINPQSATAGSDHLALWMTESTLNEFFEAFESVGIFLASIKPRFLNKNSENTSAQTLEVFDRDEDTETYALLEGNILKSLLHVQRNDLEQDVFRAQWLESIQGSDAAQRIEINAPTDFYTQADAQANADYCFYPSGALNVTHKTAQGKQSIAAAAAVLVILLMAAIPFIAQSIEFRSLAVTLGEQRELASDARQDQAAVVSFENEWGLISDFPEQNIDDAMFTLQNILRPDTLTSMEVSEGLIKIQGNSNEPQAILQRLEQDPMFTEVVFSRATNNTRYYIDLRLSTVNFEGYMIRYFPDA